MSDETVITTESEDDADGWEIDEISDETDQAVVDNIASRLMGQEAVTKEDDQ